MEKTLSYILLRIKEIESEPVYFDNYREHYQALEELYALKRQIEENMREDDKNAYK